MTRINLFILLWLMLFSHVVRAQCTGGTSGGNITPTAAWSSVGTVNIPGGTYKTFNATAGATYYFSFCAADGGSSNFDTQITIQNATGTPVPGAYNDDFCGVASYLAWTAPATNTYRVLVNLYNCASNANLGKLVYRFSAPLTCPGNLGGGVTNVASLPYASGAGTTCGSGNDLTTSNVQVCGSASYYGGEDRVWIFTPAATGTVTITLTSTGTWNGLMLYQGCPLNGQGGSCVAVSQSSAGNQSITACVTSGITYYLILDVFPSPTCNPYTNLTISAPVPIGGCPLGTGVNSITLPYTSTGRTTCGKINDLTATNTVSCGNSSYFTGEDEVFTFTPTASGDITINLTSTGSYTGITLYRGCPLSTVCSGSSPVCVAYEQSSTGNKSLCASVIAGQTYYLIIDSWASPACNPYGISISAPTPTAAGSLCSNAIPVSTLPFNLIGESTACNGNDYTNTSTGSCGTLYESGEDRVYVYNATSSECIAITLSGASSNSIGYQVYLGCPGSAGTTCIGSNGGANSGTLTGSVVLPGAGTYYIVVDSWAPPTNVSYNINITSFGSGAANDLPCNAQPLLIGVPFSSANTCAGGTNEPAPPFCWTTPNVVNTVWFSVIAPASGQLRFRTIPISLTNPQSALYSGTCGSTMTLLACNDNATACGSTINYSSEITATGLTPGATYYISVDGYANLTGTFSILAIDGNTPLPPLTNGQDCGTYLPVCDTTMSFGDPGFQAFGNICDFPGGGNNCLLSGERGSVWFEIPINANGFLEFSIIPKDWPGAPSTAGTDYDFAVWKTLGTGAVTCAQIANGATPVSCNYSFLGLTGTYSATINTAPPPYPGFGAAFNTQITVTAGEKYVLVVSNFTNSTSGFDIIFSNTSPVQYGAAGNASIWSGGIDTDWFKKDNWGGCPVPDCSRDAMINGGIVLQPSINGIAYVKSLTINPGASLTIPAAQTLSVCGNLTNFGILSASPTSNVLFGNLNVNQSMNGNLTGGNAFGNLTISKTGGWVNTTQNADVRGNMNVSNATSAFDLAGKRMKVAGNFQNLGVFNPNGGTVEFNGSAAQTYFNNGQLQHVVMNHTGPGLSLSTNLELNTSGILTLTAGRILTNIFETKIFNRAPAAVSPGNAGSYVQGYLRRYLNATGSYDFPVGVAAKGYQRANMNFAYPGSPTAIDNLLSYFTTYAATPAPLGVVDCGGTLFSSNALDNGKWIFQASNSPTSGNYDLTLYNLNFTNAANAWTIMSSSGSGWTLANGTCVVSPVTAVRRNNMNGMFEFGTAQGPSALPVQYLSIDATPEEEQIDLHWVTAYEKDNRGFTVQRLNTSTGQFESLGWVDGYGTCNMIHHYSFIDKEVVAETDYFYRLEQSDINGSTSYSDVVYARIQDTDELNITVHPNPANASSVLTIGSTIAGTYTLDVTDPTGKICGTRILTSGKDGQLSYRIDQLFSITSTGLYTITIQKEGNKNSIKLLIFK
jgi:hypothetical protein